MVCGLTWPFGWLPAEKAWKRPAPSLLRIASAMIERAELPVQRNSVLNICLAIGLLAQMAGRGRAPISAIIDLK